jgi:hypothetical protein
MLLAEAGSADMPVPIGRARFMERPDGSGVVLMGGDLSSKNRTLTTPVRAVYGRSGSDFIALTQSGSYYLFNSSVNEVQDWARRGGFQFQMAGQPSARGAQRAGGGVSPRVAGQAGGAAGGGQGGDGPELGEAIREQLRAVFDAVGPMVRSAMATSDPEEKQVLTAWMGAFRGLLEATAALDRAGVGLPVAQRA